MTDLILPTIQLNADAWRNVIKALREHDDAHLVACAAAIEQQMDRIEENFGDDMSGTVAFKVTATLRGGI